MKKQVYDSIMAMSSEDGLKIDKYRLKARLPLNVSVAQPSSDVISVDFLGDDKPKVEVKKIIKINVTVLGIIFGNDEWTVRLESFPDISFKYDSEEEEWKQFAERLDSYEV